MKKIGLVILGGIRLPAGAGAVDARTSGVAAAAVSRLWGREGKKKFGNIEAAGEHQPNLALVCLAFLKVCCQFLSRWQLQRASSLYWTCYRSPSTRRSKQRPRYHKSALPKMGSHCSMSRTTYYTQTSRNSSSSSCSRFGTPKAQDQVRMAVLRNFVTR